MKISPAPSAVTPSIDSSGVVAPSRVDSIRSFKMRTNATPLTNQDYMQQMQGGDTTQQNSTGDVVEATQPLSPQLALLARQKRALLAKEREFQRQKRDFESRSSGSNAIDVSRIKSEPLRVLLENGVTYDQLTEAIMANQGNSEVYALEQKLKSLEEGIEQKFTEREAQNEKQVLAEMQREALNLVRSNDEFEMVRETRSVPTAMKLIERMYRETGEVLDVSEALGLVENELFKDAQKLSKLKKMQSQFSPQAPQYQPQQRFNQGMRTLTNRDTATMAISAKQRAMAAFYGTNKR